MSEHKKVWIHRTEPKGNLPKDVRKNAVRRLSSVFKNRKPLKGLDRDEEKVILPKIIDADPDEGSAFYEKASRYWKELNINVPSGGKVLNISTSGTKEIDDGKEVPEPEFPQDYVAYRFAQAHPKVAETEQKAKANPNKLFYIVDPDEMKRNKRQHLDAKSKAWEEFIQMKENEDKLDLMLRVFSNTNPDKINDIDEKVNQLGEELEKRPKAFVDKATDDDLEKQDFVLQCLEYGVLRKVGTQIMFEDEVIGTGVDEVVAYLKNKRNSSTLSTLKAKLSEAK